MNVIGESVTAAGFRGAAFLCADFLISGFFGSSGKRFCQSEKNLSFRRPVLLRSSDPPNDRDWRFCWFCKWNSYLVFLRQNLGREMVTMSKLIGANN